METLTHLVRGLAGQVTVTPRFVVVNCLDMDISLRQCGEWGLTRFYRLKCPPDRVTMTSFQG